MRKLFFSFILSIIVTLNIPTQASAESNVAGSSASLNTTYKAQEDVRVSTLRKYLSTHNSPLANYADVFVETADRYGLDWRLVPAISGVESTFGKRIPKGSYNAYGWANGDYRFESWEESIEIVSNTLRTKYIDRGAPSVNKIARRYAPPSSTWAWKVKFFMNRIDPMPVYFDFEG